MIDEMATLLNAKQVEMRAYCVKSFDEISNEWKSVLIKVGWNKDFIEKLPKETSKKTKFGTDEAALEVDQSTRG